MSEVRLIDANALKLMKVVECDGHTIEYAAGWKRCVEYCKNDAPTVDAVPVKCKECKWWDEVYNIDGVSYGICERKCTAIRKDAFPNENWFCADGERKDGAE